MGTDQEATQARLIAEANEVQAAWRQLYDRVNQVELDGYVTTGRDLFIEAMQRVTDQAQAIVLERGGSTNVDRASLYRHLYEEATAALDQLYPRKNR
jgi:hypothetical protein